MHYESYDRSCAYERRKKKSTNRRRRRRQRRVCATNAVGHSVLLLTVLALPLSLCLSLSLSACPRTVDRPVARPCIAHYDQLWDWMPSRGRNERGRKFFPRRMRKSCGVNSKLHAHCPVATVSTWNFANPLLSFFFFFFPSLCRICARSVKLKPKCGLAMKP